MYRVCTHTGALLTLRYQRLELCACAMFSMMLVVRLSHMLEVSARRVNLIGVSVAVKSQRRSHLEPDYLYTISA